SGGGARGRGGTTTGQAAKNARTQATRTATTTGAASAGDRDRESVCDRSEGRRRRGRQESGGVGDPSRGAQTAADARGLAARVPDGRRRRDSHHREGRELRRHRQGL